MHAVYNYSGFVDIARAITKLKRTRARAQAGKCSADSAATQAEKGVRGLRTKSGRG